MRYILASASPRRKELLEQAGFVFDVIPSGAQEVIKGDSPAGIVENLACLKAADVWEKMIGTCQEDMTVIGADTVVSYHGEILGKPADEDEALDMLSMLADRTHQVYTGVCLMILQNGRKRTLHFHECTDVTLYPVSRPELKAYIASGDPLDKAGAYGIQGPFAVHIREIRGDYNNVVGLPIARLYQELKKLSLLPF